MDVRRILPLLAVGGLVLSACTGTSVVDPGAQVGAVTPVRLTLASGNSSTASVPAVQRFIDQVEKQTQGRVVVSLTYVETNTAKSTEPMLVQDVARGAHDLGWVGVRAMPAAGARTFGVLEAPGLIDDYAVQRAVLTDQLTKTLLASTKAVGVEGLAILGDHLRDAVGGTAPVRNLADLNGRELWVHTVSEVEVDTVKALGARVSSRGFSEVKQAMGEQGFGAVLDSNNMLDNDIVPGFLTPNLVLWPKALVVVANPDSLAKLPSADAYAVRAAAADAASYSLSVGPTTDGEQMARLCGLGARVLQASDAELAEIDAAFAPVYAGLRTDATTGAMLDRILQIKRGVPPEPVPVPSACSEPGQTPSPKTSTSIAGSSTSVPSRSVPSRPAAAATPLDGTYRQVVTADDLRRVGFTESVQPNGAPCSQDGGPVLNCLIEDSGTFTYTFERGRYSWTQRQAGAVTLLSGTGYYVVDHNTLVLVDDVLRPDGTPFDQHLTWTRSTGGAVEVTADDDWNVSRQMAANPWIPVG